MRAVAEFDIDKEASSGRPYGLNMPLALETTENGVFRISDGPQFWLLVKYRQDSIHGGPGINGLINYHYKRTPLPSNTNPEVFRFHEQVPSLELLVFLAWTASHSRNDNPRIRTRSS